MKSPVTTLTMTLLSLGTSLVVPAAENPSVAAQAVNALALDLLAKGTEANANALLSPYSIQAALAMTYAGAAGDTRTQMAKVLHYPADEATLHPSFTALQQALEEVTKTTAERAKNAKQTGGPGEPVILTVANRLFGQQGYEFRQPFLDLVKASYSAPLQMMDFIGHADQERLKINGWVEDQTHKRIRDLIPAKGLTEDTRMVLVNAIYDYLYISEVFHKTFLALDEKGTEAAAATALVVVPLCMPDSIEKPKPIEVRVDRPFLFTIQHRPSGACLFIGRVTDPR